MLDEVELLAEKEGAHVKKHVVEESDTVGKAIIDYAKNNNFDVIISYKLVLLFVILIPPALVVFQISNSKT